MRKINYIVIHCSDTEAGRNHTVFDIDRWHKQRGWVCVGYHFVITLNGTLQHGRPLESIGAHCLHYNEDSIGICYIGGRKDGKTADTRTVAQCATLEQLVSKLLRQFPNAKVCGHTDLNPGKACPCFNVRQWAISVGIPPHNIYRYAQ